MRVILDTNVFVSGIFFSGPPHEILEAWRHGRIRLVISPEILEEYRRVGEELPAFRTITGALSRLSTSRGASSQVARAQLAVGATRR